MFMFFYVFIILAIVISATHSAVDTDRASSVFLSVCPLVTTVHFVKNGRFDRDAVWAGGSGWPKKHVIDAGPSRSTHKK